MILSKSDMLLRPIIKRYIKFLYLSSRLFSNNTIKTYSLITILIRFSFLNLIRILTIYILIKFLLLNKMIIYNSYNLIKRKINLKFI